MPTIPYTVLNLESGATFLNTINVLNDSNVALNLTGYTASSQMRKSYYSDIDSYTITAAVKTPPTSGVVEISLTPTQTSLITPGRYVFDVEISNGTNTIRILEGIIVVSPNATRS
jgi:hypothetical protein